MFVTDFTNRKLLSYFLHLPRVPLLLSNRKFMKFSNSSVTAAYLGSTLALFRGIWALVFLRSEVVERLLSFKRAWRASAGWNLECQEIPVSPLKQEMLTEIWARRAWCSPKWLKVKRKGLALEKCTLFSPPPSNRLLLQAPLCTGWKALERFYRAGGEVFIHCATNHPAE